MWSFYLRIRISAMKIGWNLSPNLQAFLVFLYANSLYASLIFWSLSLAYNKVHLFLGTTDPWENVSKAIKYLFLKIQITLPYLTNVAAPFLSLQGHSYPSSTYGNLTHCLTQMAFEISCQMTFFKNLPKFGEKKTISGSLNFSFAFRIAYRRTFLGVPEKLSHKV